MKILPNNSSLIYSGRIDLSDPFAIVWTYPGTFVRMKFKGTQLFIHVRNKHNYWNNYLGVAEGDAQTKLLLPEEGEATIEIPLQTTQDNIHEVDVYERQNYICAGVIITLLPALIIFILCQKQIYGGLAAGSVKG